jgi:2-polyprenyl-3-methyl-5-hydroxy-6-metoxy-1,4-benzoquinol methylase
MGKSEEFWDKSSKNYDKTEERFEQIHRKTREYTKRYLHDDDVVLDYGCGTGTNSCEFSSFVKEIHAIDISSKMIEAARDKASTKRYKNLHFMQTTIFDNEYTEGSFDVILAFNILHTVSNPEAVINRIFKLLKPDGLFISSTPCLKGRKSFLVNMQIYLVRILLKIGIIPIPIRRYKSSDLKELISGGNFQAIEKEEIYKGASSYFTVAKKAKHHHE